MKWGLSDKIIKDMQKVFIRYPVKKVILFGSRARGTHSPTSDIDLAIFAPEMSHKQLNLLRADLDELDIIYRIDVVHMEELSKLALMDRIMLEGVEIYSQE